MKSNISKENQQEIVNILRNCGDRNKTVALYGQELFAKAVQIPINQAIINDVNIVSNVFSEYDLRDGRSPQFATDLIRQGQNKLFTAYVSNGYGKIPERQFEADFIQLRTYMVDNAIDVLLTVLRDANWNVASRLMDLLYGGFLQKMNVDGWRTIITAAASRNLQIFDTAGTDGVLSRRLLSLIWTEFTRRANGYYSSVNPKYPTHIFISPEGMGDIINWDSTQVDDYTRRELFLAKDGTIPELNNMRIVTLPEFGAGGDLQNFYINTLGQPLQDGKLEIGVAININDGNFIMPVREDLQINTDENLHRAHKAGWYGWYEQGYAVLDSRDAMIFSF